VGRLLAVVALVGCGDEPSQTSAVEPAGRPPSAPAVLPTVAVPESIVAPPWLESRRAAQLASADAITAFHDFRYTNRLRESGIDFVHRGTVDSGKKWVAVHYDHGNSVSVADVDGDGHEDILFISQLDGNGLWRNRGDGTFEAFPEHAGVGMPDRVSVAGSFADTDNDGDPDLFVTTVRGGNVLFENVGSRFEDVTAVSGLGYVGHSSAGIFFDYNRDGLLDLFVANVGRYTRDTRTRDGNYVGLDDAFGGHLKPERFEQSILYENKGGNRFEDVSERVGLRDTSWTGDAMAADFNEDGWPDLYVLNMQGLDEYYENQGGERFVRRTEETFPRSSWGSMGVQAFDWDNDGDRDLFITDMHSDMSIEVGPELEKKKADIQWAPDFLMDGGKAIYGNSFFRNDGAGVYTEISDAIGAENYWPWGLSAGDLNADGFEDVFITSGMNYPWRYGINTLLLNEAGQRFVDAEFVLGVEPRPVTTGPWFELDCDGEDRHHRDCEDRTGRWQVEGALGSRSSVLFDLDGDGDLDIVTNDFRAAPMVLVSDLSERRNIHYLSVDLQGVKSNRDGLGARVQVRAGDDTYVKVHDGRSGYLAQSAMPLYFGLADHAVVDEVRVQWPSGAEQVLAGPIETNHRLEIVEGS
jgi:hypothetical protein